MMMCPICRSDFIINISEIEVDDEYITTNKCDICGCIFVNVQKLKPNEIKTFDVEIVSHYIKTLNDEIKRLSRFKDIVTKIHARIHFIECYQQECGIDHELSIELDRLYWLLKGDE